MYDYPCVDYVILKMLDVIPVTEVNFINDLNSLLEKMWNQGPEVKMSVEYWNYLHLFSFKMPIILLKKNYLVKYVLKIILSLLL
jgi:hypothetical protein